MESIPSHARGRPDAVPTNELGPVTSMLYPHALGDIGTDPARRPWDDLPKQWIKDKAQSKDFDRSASCTWAALYASRSPSILDRVVTQEEEKEEEAAPVAPNPRPLRPRACLATAA